MRRLLYLLLPQRLKVKHGKYAVSKELQCLTLGAKARLGSEVLFPYSHEHFP